MSWFIKCKKNLNFLITTSKIDSKGRITIPIKLRARFGLLEGSKVRIIGIKGKLLVIPCSECEENEGKE